MKKYFLIALSFALLLTIYLSQGFNLAATMLPESWAMAYPHAIFIFNRTARLILNDLVCMFLIYVLFKNKIYLRAAFYLFLVELLILLPIYFIIKLNLEGDSELSSPLLSQIHRLIVNPLLMFLLILGFVYQRLKVEKT